MLANNELGVIQPISGACQVMPGAWMLAAHRCDASGWEDANGCRCAGCGSSQLLSSQVLRPKGIGGLYVRNRDRRVRLDPQMLGGGHQGNRRSGTLPVSGIVGMAAALEKCEALSQTEPARILSLRDNLFTLLKNAIPDLKLNGPELSSLRLGGNLNCEFPGVRRGVDYADGV